MVKWRGKNEVEGVICMILVALAGAFGGALRGVVGIAQKVVTNQKFKMNWNWFLVSVGVAAVIGMVAATFFGEDLRLAFLAGYAGSDLVDTFIKTKMKEKFEEKE